MIAEETQASIEREKSAWLRIVSANIVGEGGKGNKRAKRVEEKKDRVRTDAGRQCVSTREVEPRYATSRGRTKSKIRKDNMRGK